MHTRDAAIEPATDDWPFLYLRDRHIAASLHRRAGADPGRVRGRRALGHSAARAGGWSWQFFLLGAGFMLLETKAIIQFALLWGSTWVVASLAIAAVLSMALFANFDRLADRDPPAPGWSRAVLVALLALNGADPGRPGGASTAAPPSRCSTRPDVQPDPLRRPAVRLGDQALDLAGARLRHQPARRDGGRRG